MNSPIAKRGKENSNSQPPEEEETVVLSFNRPSYHRLITFNSPCRHGIGISKLESLFFLAGIAGNILSALIYISPIPTFRQIVKKGSTEEFSGFPYICSLLAAALWVYYGFTKPGAILVAIVNMFGVVTELIYVILFLMYAPPHVRVKTGVMAATLDVVFLGLSVLITHFTMHGSLRITVIGFLCAGPSILMYASPLSIMRTVIATKSLKYMPFLLSFILFLGAGAWTLYAALGEDLFVGVPNGIGFLLAMAQLILHAMYRNSKSKINGPEESREPPIQPVEVHQNVEEV